jgi:hypothetical protein
MMMDPVGAYMEWVEKVAGDNITVGSLLVLVGALAVAVPVVIVVTVLS